ELQLGHALQPQARSDLAPEERRRALERARRIAPRLVVAESREMHARDLQVRADVHTRQRHEPDPRVVDLAGEERGQFAANLVGNAVRTRALRHAEVSSLKSQLSGVIERLKGDQLETCT